MSYQVKKVGVVGAGLMGTGIAEVCAIAGLPTVLVRATGGDPGEALGRIRGSIEARVAKGKLEPTLALHAMNNLSVTADMDALLDCNLIIESIVEDLAEKRALFARLAPRVADDTVFASNTSTLKIGDIAAGIREGRTIGLHFFSPVPAMSLVELAHVEGTDEGVVSGAEAFIARLGKTAVPVLDSTGFIVNRLLVPVLLNAINAYGQGLANAEQIDTAMRLGCGHPMGPLALSDLIGLDIVYAMAKLLYKDFGDACYRPPAILRRMVQDGALGKKTGLGFYDYGSRPARPNQALWNLVRIGALREAPVAQPAQPSAA
jgi:3-hydroxybutyryl-CoA dehydrogenase